jgi:RNA polymerase sigma-54 factor
VDTTLLETAFAATVNGARGVFDQTLAAIKGHDEMLAIEELKKLAAQPELTKEQTAAVNHALVQVREKRAFVEARNYIRDKIRAGKFLIKSLDQRQQTILNIGKEIVKRQREFMEKGIAFLKPMTMQQVAEVVGVHETTVSRAVSGKYIQTPQGIFEMKYFFTAGIQTADGGEMMSNTSVKDMVAEIFKAENGAQPLSDQEVVKMLADKGVVIARRTVAKYRGELNILPSNLRKVY